MSTPPQGRGISLQIVRGGNGMHRGSVHALLEAQSPGDDELMIQVKANDSNALQVLFARYSRLVLSIAVRILRDFGEAEGIVQESFFDVFQKAILFDPLKGTVKAWIIQIAFHKALDKKSYLDRRGFYGAVDISSLDNTLLGETDLDREVGAKLDRGQIDKALEGLPEVQRRTLELFYFEGLGLREISGKLNESIGNVRHHFYRGLERLRKSVFVQRLH